MEGCLVDVVNLLFAMVGKYKLDDSENLEAGVVELVKQTGSKLLRNDLDGLWIPTHFMHDAENDDLLCWLLLEWLRRKCGTPLSVLVQVASLANPAGCRLPLLWHAQASCSRKLLLPFAGRVQCSH